MLSETRHYGIPATLRGMVNNDLKATADAVLSLVKDGATDGVQIDPTLFSQYGIRSVPALVVFCSQGTTSSGEICASGRRWRKWPPRVTAGGDGGLKNDGTTEWATGETGKTITESFMNKPKDILSPDAPFIQTGRDVVNRADSIVGNTGQQCSAQEISRSEYTNYTCERDLQVEQYCTRTARMELQGSTTWETRTLEYEMSQLPAREVNGQYVVSMTSPVTGEIVDAHYSWSRTYLQKSVPMTITVLGTPLSWNAKYSADASFTPVQKTLTAGVAFTSSHPVRVGNTKFRRHTAMKLRLVVRVKKPRTPRMLSGLKAARSARSWGN